MNELAPIPVQSITAQKGPHTPLPRHPSWAAGAGFVGGDYRPVSEAAIPITDLGFMRADAVYDVVSVVRGPVSSVWPTIRTVSNGPAAGRS